MQAHGKGCDVWKAAIRSICARMRTYVSARENMDSFDREIAPRFTQSIYRIETEECFGTSLLGDPTIRTLIYKTNL